jgi:hypothetical protein
MAKKFPIHPSHPERICWGCDLYCPADSMACANERSAHPSELFGEDWFAWGNSQTTAQVPAVAPDELTKIRL